MLRRFLLKNWREFTKTDVPETLQVVPISSCLNDYGNDIVLIFIDEAAYPEYILKTGRNPAYSFKLENEFHSLKNLHNERKLSAYIPKPYYMGSYDKNTFILQGGFEGIALSRLIRQKGASKKVRSLIDQSIDLLVEIGRTKCVKESNSRNTSYETDRVYEFIENELTSEKHKDKIRALREYQRVLEKKDNKIYLHGDYWQTNIIVDYNKPKINGIIDWEFSQPEAAYPGDIVSFIINLGHCLLLHENPGASILDAYKSVFFTPGVYNKIIFYWYHKYMSAIGWDKSLLNTILEMMLAEMSMRELISYGKHGTMDQIWKELLIYTFDNEEKLCLSYYET